MWIYRQQAASLSPRASRTPIRTALGPGMSEAGVAPAGLGEDSLSGARRSTVVSIAKEEVDDDPSEHNGWAHRAHRWLRHHEPVPAEPFTVHPEHSVPDEWVRTGNHSLPEPAIRLRQSGRASAEHHQ